MHSAAVAVGYMVGGSSGEYALASTVSPKRKRGVISFLFVSSFSCRLLGGGVRLSFLCVMTFGSWVVGRVSSIPTIFRVVGFAASVAFERFACTVIGLSVNFLSLLPFVAFQFSEFGLVVSEFVTIEAVSFFGVLRRVLDLFCLWFCLSRFAFIVWYQIYFVCAPRLLNLISRSKWSTISLYGLSSRYALLRIFFTWSGISA